MSDPEYAVYIRVPIPRGDFVDPPPVIWDSSKDEALWNILSSAGKAEIDWNELATRFDATVEFLLRQVNYLTERHASQVRAQVRKATAAAKGSAAPSPTPGAEPPSAAHQRTPSSLSVRRDSPLPRNDASGTHTPISTSLRPNISRNTSANTTVLAQLGGGASPRLGKAGFRPVEGSRRRLSSLPITTTSKDVEVQSPELLESSSDETSGSSPAQSRIIRRPPRFQGQEGASPFADDDDTEPAFQPYVPEPSATSGQDLGATLRGDGNRQRPPKSSEKQPIHKSQTSDSSAGSAAIVPRTAKVEDRQPPGPLSPKRTAELQGRSPGPGGKGKETSRDGSDGTPSMGSSFSDLDDASVTQSAMAEAFAAGMQDGGLGSRFSIAQSLSRRFVPKKGPQ